MIDELESVGPIGEEIRRRAERAGVLSIWRTQCRSVQHIVVRRGKPESTSISSVSGHGIQIATPEGRSALASRDDLDGDEALALFDRGLDLARRTAGLGVGAVRLPELTPLNERQVPKIDGFDRIRLDEVGRRLAELEAEILSRVPGTQLSMSYRAELDAWRVFRSDGTDVLFAMPRCSLGARATNAEGDSRHSVGASVFSCDPRVPWDEEGLTRFLKRATRAARLARDLPGAPNHPAGSFPLVIDYALAKGLAHEAFGHASEADGYRSSVLAVDGRFRVGHEVGASHVSIIDEPVPHDHAWQPYSANGVRRERATVVDHGRLADGLSDLWSAEAGGIRLTGAARAESFHDAPQPRMTNIRIELDEPLPAPGEFEDYGPEEVRGLLDGAGVFSRHPRVVFLSGYSGGQVNPTSGDFVFNCKAIYVLGRDGIEFYKPAIFSGSMFGALHAIREGFGPLKLDALGYCGKWGQSVPSSGGSHYFLVLEPDPAVRLGGLVKLARLLEAVGRERPDGVGIEAWSIFASESRTLTLGIKDRQIGNAHAPLKLGDNCDARYRLIWRDGKFSRGHIERRLLETEPERAIAEARAAAYDDEDAACVLDPAAVPQVEMYCEKTAALAGGATNALVPRLAAIRERVAVNDFRTWSGSFTAAVGRSLLLTSTGMEAESRGTTTGWHVTINGEVGDGFSARAAESDADFEARLDRLIGLAGRLQETAEPRPAGTHPVILHPNVVESYALDTLLENLSGGTVAHGEGHFKKEQFGSGHPVLREDLGLRLDPLQPLKCGSYRFTSEGVPARRCVFIERGRLVQPVLDVKYARRLCLSPTPLPLSADTLFLEGPKPLPLDQALVQAAGGVLILSVLGTHTQDSASGDFSLSAPQALAIGPAGLAGRLRATISGNLFETLASDTLRFVRFEGEHTPGLLFPCRLDPR